MLFTFSAFKDGDINTLQEEDLQESVEMNFTTNNNVLDYPDLKMVPFKGDVIEFPLFDPGPVFCGSIPYPSGFRNIGGRMTHLGNIEGGYIEFLNCVPDILDGIPVFVAESVGEFHSSSGDKVYYEGTLIFNHDGTGEGINENYITNGTGRWEDAK